MAKPSSNRRRAADEAEASIAAELSYSEAQTALELALAELQSPDLAVEAMTALYNRARSYAERCEQLLLQVEQTVTLWDPEVPGSTPQPYTP